MGEGSNGRKGLINITNRNILQDMEISQSNFYLI